MTRLKDVIPKYRDLRFVGAAVSLALILSQAEASEPSYLRFAERLVDHEIDSRQNKRIQLNRRKASLPLTNWVEEFDDRDQTTITKREVNRRLDVSFIDNRHNIVFIAPAGVGKTHLAIAIGVKGTDAGRKVLVTTTLALVEAPELPEIKKRMNTYLKLDVLIIDELCYLPTNCQGI
jgi:DNA replication protein DnaC